MSDFETQFNKNIVGGKSEQEKKQAHEKLQQELEENSYKDTKPYEIEPSKKDRQIIDFAINAVDKIIASYGGTPKSFLPEKIFILKEGAVSEITDGKLREGFHSLLKQRIVVERGESDVHFATTVVHELLHLKSFKAAQIIDGEIEPYRAGITVFDRSAENEYFAKIEEAIVSEVTRQFYTNEICRNSLFKSEVEKTEKIKVWIKKDLQLSGMDETKQQRIMEEIFFIPDADDILEFLNGEVDSDDPEMYKIGYVNGAFRVLMENGDVKLSERYVERKALYDLLDEIVEKSDGEIKNRKEIFDEFAKANFSGKLLPLARIIENTLGKGSFREIAEKFKVQW